MNHQPGVYHSTMIERIDDVYNLAYWMSGDEATAGMLVSQTYLEGGQSKTAVELFKAFRNVYLRSFGQETTIEHDGSVMIDDQDVARVIVTMTADFKLTVLLADVVGLTHSEIAQVIEQPLATVRVWLHWGRKLIGQEVNEKVN